jgi:nucleotide-binding universal stress UspA family protein
MPGLTALIPLDGTKLSESAFALLPFAKQLGVAKVVLLSVWESEWDREERIPGREESELQEVAEKGRAYLGAYLNSQAEHVTSMGFEAETVVRIGRAAEEALEYIGGAGVDLVLIATHGRSGIARWRLGSVADSIIRNAPCPVLVIGPNVNVELAPYALKRVLVPLDGSALAEQALPVATWVARVMGAEIDLVRSISVTAVAYDEGYGVYPVDLLTAMEDAAKTYLDRIAAALGGNVRTALLIGGAGDQILEYLQENPAGLVVMAAHGRAGVTRLVLGSVTDRVLHGPAPVLVLRPEAEAKSALVEAAKSAG